MAKPLYAEIFIRAGLDELWHRTQDPACHQQWDARFSRITYLSSGPVIRFGYATRIAPGITVRGSGVTVGETSRPDGARTSALRFASDSRWSPVRRGTGYWRYVPVDGGVRFLTGYQYAPGLGRFVDRLVRPVLGWATAWSFDRLRIWVELGIGPRRAFAHAVVEAAARLGLVTAAVLTARAASPLVALFLVTIPPTPLTPAARRCVRRPPDRTSGTAPTTARILEEPS